MTDVATHPAAAWTVHRWTRRDGTDEAYVLSHVAGCPDLADHQPATDDVLATVPEFPCDCRVAVHRLPAAGRPGEDDHHHRLNGSQGGPSGSAAPSPPSDRQRAYIARLAAERGVDVDPAWLASAKAAHTAIDKLLALPVPAASASKPARSNRYDAPCRRCGQVVPAGEGSLDRDGGAWVVTHVGDCPTPAPTPAPATSSPASTGYEPERGDVHVLDDTYYRVSVGQHSGRFYVTRWAGNEWEYEGARLLRRLSVDTLCTAEQAAAFGAAYSRCVFCTRDLDTPESITVGYGPVCAAKRGLPWG